MSHDSQVTLMDWGNAYVRSKTVSSTGVVTGLKMDLHLEGDFKKTKKKVTWLSSPSSSNPTTPLTLIDYDYLITKKKLEDTDSASDFITPTTEFREDAMGDSNVLKDVKKGDTVQFERKGYYICDSVGGEGEKSEAKRWEFIAIPDGRAGSVESKEVARREREAKAAKAAKGGAAAGAVEGGEKKKSKKAEKKEAAAAGAEGGAKKGGKKAAAPEAKPAALSETKVVKSEGTAGFEIPVSTTVSYLASSVSLHIC
jgi:glutamyl-tRNA synthetase